MNNPIRVLYIDDSALDRELVRVTLLKAGPEKFSLTEAASRKEFEAKLIPGNYDLVLTDFNILGFEGLQVLEAVKKVDPSLAVIIVTGTGSEEVAVEAMKRGAGDYVIKSPAHIRRLPQTILAVLEKNSLARERQEATETLRQAHEQLAAIVREAPLAVVTLDLQGNVLSWNPNAERLIGWKEAEALGKPFPLASQGKTGDFNTLLDQALNGEKFKSAEIRRQRRDGSWMDVELHTTPLHDKSGQVSGLLVMMEDITERKHNDLKIRNLARFPDENPNPVIRISNDGVILYANPPCGPLLSFWDCQVGMAMKAEYRQFIQTVIEKGKDQELEINTGDRFYRILLTPVLEAGYLNGYASDITERKLAEKALLESEAKFRSYIEHAPVAVFVADQTGKYIEVNHAAEGLLGYDAASLLQMNIMDVLSDQDRERGIHDFSSLFQTGFVDSEYQFIKSGGTTVWAHLRAGQLSNNRVIAFCQDISGRKQAEEALQASKERLSKVIENSEDGITITDCLGKIIEWSKAQELITGIPQAEALGKSIWLVSKPLFIEANRTEAAAELMKQAVLDIGHGKPSIWSANWFEQELAHPDGERRFVLLRSFEIQADGEVLLGTITRDVTRQRNAEAKIIRQAAEFAALYETNSEFNHQRDLPNLFEAILAQATRLLKVPNAAILLTTSAGDTLEVAASRGLVFNFTQPLPFGKGMAGKVAQTRQPIWVNDYEASEYFLPEFKELGFTAFLQVPLLYAGELVGTLGVSESKPNLRTFSESDVRLLSMFAAIAASAVHNTRLYEETKEQAAQLGLLYDAGLTINSLLEPKAQLEMLFKVAREVIKCDRVEFLRYYAEKRELFIEMVLGFSPEIEKEMVGFCVSLENDQGIATQVGKTLSPINLPDVTQSANNIQFDPKVRSGVWVPVLHGNQLLGVLAVLRTGDTAFTGQEERLLMLFANQSAVAMENARLFNETQTRIQFIESLRNIDIAIASSIDLQVVLNVIVDQLLFQLKVDAADVLLFNPNLNELEYKAGKGFQTHLLRQIRLRMGDGYAGKAALEGKMVVIPDLPGEPNFSSVSPVLAEEGFIAYFGIPLISKGQVKGVLEVFQRSPYNLDPIQLEFLEAAAGQTAIAIDNATLFTNLRQSTFELSIAYDAAIEGWSRALDLRDRETEGHSRRVTEMTVRLGREMGLSEAELIHIQRGAWLHDIGKMGVPDNILLKPGPLDPEEWEIMQKHPVYARDLLLPMKFAPQVIDIPYCHHEKWDGSGYPQGLLKEQIPFAARIFSIVDVWDALASDRPYRKAWPKDKIFAYLKEQSGIYFDPQVVEKFLPLIMPNPADPAVGE